MGINNTLQCKPANLPISIPTVDLKDIDELAAILRVPKSWIYGQTRLKNLDGIPYLRVGKYLRFDLSAVIGWLEKRTASRRGEK